MELLLAMKLNVLWHASKFDVRTGEVKEPPASEPEPVYQIKVDGNSILLKK